MTIIYNIFKFLGKKYFDRDLLQKRSAQNSQHFIGVIILFVAIFNNSHNAICCEDRVYLDSNSSLCSALERLDFKMLLDQFKEQLHMPTIFIKKSYLQSTFFIVCKVNTCIMQVSRIISNAMKSNRTFLTGQVICKFYNLIREYSVCIMRCISLAYNFILKIYYLSYHEIGLNIMIMIEPLEVKVSAVKHIVSSPFIRDTVHRALIMHFCLSDMDERRDNHFDLVKRMHLDTSFSAIEFYPSKDALRKIDSFRNEGIHLPIYLKVFVESLLYMISKRFKDARLASFFGFCEIASRYVLAKANILALSRVYRNRISEIMKTVTVVNSNRYRCFSSLRLYI